MDRELRKLALVDAYMVKEAGPKQKIVTYIPQWRERAAGAGGLLVGGAAGALAMHNRRKKQAGLGERAYRFAQRHGLANKAGLTRKGTQK